MFVHDGAHRVSGPVILSLYSTIIVFPLAHGSIEQYQIRSLLIYFFVFLSCALDVIMTDFTLQCNGAMTTIFIRSLKKLPSLQATVLSLSTNILATVSALHTLHTAAVASFVMGSW
jgi:hypothetical protein